MDVIFALGLAITLAVVAGLCLYWRFKGRLASEQNARRRVEKERNKMRYESFHFLGALRLAVYYKEKAHLARDVEPSVHRIDRSVKAYLAEAGYDPKRHEPTPADIAANLEVVD